MILLPPYAEMLGLRREGQGFCMPFSEHLIGSPGRLHGGTLAGLLEIVANMTVRDALGDNQATAKPVNVTVDFLREGAMIDTFAEAFIMRLGRRVANVRAEAWQADRSRIIATARMNLLISRS
jgi:acyl-coenzyme A thioesterase PaaI-like protein